MSFERMTDSLRRFLSRVRQRRQNQAKRRTSTRLELLTLESRVTPTANASGTISGIAFIDPNNNGLRDPGENTMPGVTFVLRGQTTTGVNVVKTVQTGAGGGFRFQNVLPGTYQVFARPVAGFVPFSANGSLLAGPIGGTKLVLSRSLDGGQTLGVQAGFRMLTPTSVSLNLLLNSTPPSSVPATLKPGEGTSNVNFRPNNRPILKTALPNLTVSKNAPTRSIDLTGHFSDPDIRNSRVRIETTHGNINIVLFEKATPQTVQNFINYIVTNRYDNTVFHRLATKNASATSQTQVPFVLQGGGFKFNTNPSRLDAVLTDPAVKNEPGVSNTRGTLAMAKLGNDPNSATSQFFFNLSDNGLDGVTNLDTQNGGFTVFGRVASDADLAVLDRLAAGPTRPDLSLPAPFEQIPLRGYTGNNTTFPGDTNASNYFMIKDVKILQRNETLTYAVVDNTNPGLVTATIKQNRLFLDFVDNATGTARITIRARDRFGATVTSSFNITVNNDAPTAVVSLNPASPNTNSTLTATVTPNDNNNDPVTLTYVWKKNGTIIKTTANTSATTDTLDLSIPGNGDRGDQITVEVTPNDGTVDGAMVSASRTIVDSPPTISNLEFTPAAPGTNDLLTVTTTAEDIDGDLITFTYVWRVNNIVVKTTSNTTSITDSLDLSIVGNGDLGDTIKVDVTPVANGLTGTMVSKSVVIT